VAQLTGGPGCCPWNFDRFSEAPARSRPIARRGPASGPRVEFCSRCIACGYHQRPPASRLGERIRRRVQAGPSPVRHAIRTARPTGPSMCDGPPRLRPLRSSSADPRRLWRVDGRPGGRGKKERNTFTPSQQAWRPAWPLGPIWGRAELRVGPARDNRIAEARFFLEANIDFSVS